MKQTINGRMYEEDVEPRLLLSYFLRENIGLTGTHIGCGVGERGACSILLGNQLVKSYLHFAVQAMSANHDDRRSGQRRRAERDSGGVC